MFPASLRQPERFGLGPTGWAWEAGRCPHGD